MNGPGGYRGAPVQSQKRYAVLPVALGQALSELCCQLHDCFVPGWQEAAGARGHATQRTALGWGVLLYMACECDIEEGPRFVPVVLLTCHKGWMSELGDFCASVWERGESVGHFRCYTVCRAPLVVFLIYSDGVWI